MGMRAGDTRCSLRGCVWAIAIAGLCTGCVSPGGQAGLNRELDATRVDRDRLRRELESRDRTIAGLHRQIENLQGFSAERPADLFAPVKLEIAGLTGGADYDGKPGDDGVTVYLRPLDADGDVVKAPGRITIQLLDNTKLESPTVVGVFEFHAPAELRRLWHGRFATNHYTLKCPFPVGFKPPASGKLTVSAEFVDFLRGASLTAVKEVTISIPEG